MREGTREEVFADLTGIVRFIYEYSPSDTVAGYFVFFSVFILSAIVYKLGFSRKIKLWQNVVVYFCLFLGCVVLTFFALSLPMIEGLIVAALFLAIYKIRLAREKTT
ncbi:YlaH-like family protein [Metasolibacillus meyeri]|uniref:YlaH-like family protein n=1 Tax=Metasolibacillus meyeri TaxID=1071052 RepID=UPI000D2FE12E|nr:YlaH-like family protein [Metasolibacillus meyeri]